MPTPVQSILRSAVRQPTEKYNVISYPTHERYQSSLATCNANFYLFQGEGIKDWKSEYAALPENHILLDKSLGDKQIPPWLEIDMVLTQNVGAHFQISKQIADIYHVPMIQIHHTLPPPNWSRLQLEAVHNMRGHINLFISEYSRKEWGWNEDEADILHHGVDTDLFKPDETTTKKPYALSVVNDWINRDWCCGYSIWNRVQQGIATRVVGDTPGLSKATANVHELVKEYQQAQVFLNTSTVSPIPSVVLEAMACGLPVVSTDNCMLPEIIEPGFNGYLTNDENEMRKVIKHLLIDPVECARLGANARQTILEKFSLAKFVENWDKVLDRAANTILR